MDGYLSVVISTVFYCRPICTSVRPFENCSFNRNRGGGRSSGFRPSLRCRPNWPRSSAPVRCHLPLAAFPAFAASGWKACTSESHERWRRFGVTARHLRRAIRRKPELSPVELAQTQRLCWQTTSDRSPMTVTAPAFSAGFESLRGSTRR